MESHKSNHLLTFSCKNMFNLFKVIISLGKTTSLKGNTLPQCIPFMSQIMENFHLSKPASGRLRLNQVALIPVTSRFLKKALAHFYKGNQEGSSVSVDASSHITLLRQTQGWHTGIQCTCLSLLKP